MSLKNPDDWKSSSWVIRTEKHEAMRRLLDQLDLNSPGQLILALVEDPEATLSALEPVVKNFQAKSVKAPGAREQRKALRQKINDLTPEQVSKLLAAVEARPS
jgi:hypothetical protein